MNALYALVFICQLNMCRVPDGFGDLIFTSKDACDTMANSLNKNKTFTGLQFSCQVPEFFHANQSSPIIPEPPHE
jgi:hypothetical protein